MSKPSAADANHPLPHDELYARILRYVRRFPNRAVDLTPLADELGMAPFALQVVSVGFDIIGGCVDETNKPLLWIGVGAAAGGATLMAIGGSRHQVAVGASSVKYRFRF